MTIADEQFNRELQTVQANIDTLRNRYEQLKTKESVVTSSEKSAWGYQLGVAEKEYQNYADMARQQMDNRKKQLTAEVLDKMNDFIQEYGKQNNYQFIFGTTSEGSILHGNKTDDLTDVILEKLNGKYDNKHKAGPNEISEE